MVETEQGSRERLPLGVLPCPAPTHPGLITWDNNIEKPQINGTDRSGSVSIMWASVGQPSVLCIMLIEQECPKFVFCLLSQGEVI